MTKTFVVFCLFDLSNLSMVIFEGSYSFNMHDTWHYNINVYHSFYVYLLTTDRLVCGVKKKSTLSKNPLLESWVDKGLLSVSYPHLHVIAQIRQAISLSIHGQTNGFLHCLAMTSKPQIGNTFGSGNGTVLTSQISSGTKYHSNYNTNHTQSTSWNLVQATHDFQRSTCCQQLSWWPWLWQFCPSWNTNGHLSSHS